MAGAHKFNETILNHLLALKLDIRLLRSQIGHGQMDGRSVFYIERWVYTNTCMHDSDLTLVIITTDERFTISFAL